MDQLTFRKMGKTSPMRSTVYYAEDGEQCMEALEMRTNAIYKGNIKAV